MSFRSALLASAAILTAGSAFAADLPARSMAPAPYVAAAPIFTWTGFYVGLNAGAGWNNNSNGLAYTGFGTATPVIFGGNGNGDDAAFTGGAQIGYNMQFGSFVAGVEADINYIDRDNGSAAFVGAIPAGTTTYYTVNRSGGDNWFGTVRGRLGFAFDRALIYATGGLAYGGKGGSSTAYAVPVTGGVAGTPVALVGSGNNDSNIGWALGAGLEYAFTNSISFKAEYLHVDLGRNSSYFTAGTTGQTILVRNDNKFDVVRAGVNFRF